MKVSTWSNGKLFSITLVQNDETSSVVKTTLTKELITEVKAHVTLLEKEINSDNKKTSVVRVNKINKMFAQIKKDFFKTTEVKPIKVKNESKKSNIKQAKRELAVKDHEISLVSKAIETKTKSVNVSEKYVLNISGLNNADLLANLEIEKTRLLSLEKLANEKTYNSGRTHSTKGEY